MEYNPASFFPSTSTSVITSCVFKYRLNLKINKLLNNNNLLFEAFYNFFFPDKIRGIRIQCS